MYRKWKAFWVIRCLLPAAEESEAQSFAVVLSERMALETVPKDLRHLRACLLCSLVKVSFGELVVGAMGDPGWGKRCKGDGG